MATAGWLLRFVDLDKETTLRIQRLMRKLPAIETFGSSDDEASFLDTESSDPEIQLDLARAYISMGDKEAARVILEEVAANGSKEQQAEARKMLDLM